MKAMVEQIKGLPISEPTARLIACLRTLQEIYGEVSNVLEDSYASQVADSLLNDKLGDAFASMTKGLQECLMLSINESLGNLTIKVMGVNVID